VNATGPAGYPPPGPYGKPPQADYGPLPYGAYNQAWAQAQLNAQSKNGLGVAALICGIGGFILVPLLASIAAVILGHLGLKAAEEGLADNRSFSVAGLVLGYVGIALTVLTVAVVVVLLAIGIAIGDNPEVIGAIWQATPAFL